MRVLPVYRPAARPRLAIARTAPQDSLVADPACDTVCVEAFEQQLRGTAPDPEQVTEPSKRDALLGFALGNERPPGPLERLARDGHTVAEPDEPPLLLEEERQLRVLDLDGLQAEPRFELGGRSLAGS